MHNVNQHFLNQTCENHIQNSSVVLCDIYKTLENEFMNYKVLQRAQEEPYNIQCQETIQHLIREVREY